MTISEYAKLQNPILSLEEHFLNWYDRFQLHDTFFVKYEHIHDSLENLREFLSLPTSFIETFPAKKSRESNRSFLSAEDLRYLESTYHTYINRIEQLDNFFVRQKPDDFLHQISILSNQIYLVAYRKAILKQLPFIRKLFQIR